MDNTKELNKKQLAQKRNYFKFVLTGMIKLIDLRCLTVREKIVWKNIISARKNLLDMFEDGSKELGLNIPEYRCCICNKEAKYFDDEVFGYCYKHYKEVYED